MRFSMAAFLTGAMITAMPVFAQQGQPQGPHPKNQKELEALQKVQVAEQTGNPDQELAAINNVLENFTDTDFKPMLMSMGLRAAQQKDDPALVETWVQRAETLDPNDIEAHVVAAETTARHTRENDLDKADSLKKIDSNGKRALDLLKSATKPPMGVPDAQWPAMKAQLTGEAYDALGQSAALDKKYGDAITNFKAAIAADPNGTVIKARLAQAYLNNKQYDDSITTADQVINDANASPVVKQFAQQLKDSATRAKGAAK